MHYIVYFNWNFPPIDYLSTARVCVIVSFQFVRVFVESLPLCVTIAHAFIKIIVFVDCMIVSPSSLIVSVIGLSWMFSHSRHLNCAPSCDSSPCLAHCHE